MKKGTNSKSIILKNIQQALQQPVPVPFDIPPTNTTNLYQPQEDDLAVVFAEHFTGLQGKFFYCPSEDVWKEQFIGLAQAMHWKKCYTDIEGLTNSWTDFPFEWVNKVQLADVSLTGCESLVARTGSLLLSSADAGGRTGNVYAPVHVCIAYQHQLVYDIADALKQMEMKYENKLPSFFTLATGPSRTADIEKTLVVGVHGPKEVYCFLIDT